MYCLDARKYLQKLIRIQKTIERKGYRRADQAAVRQAREHINKYLEYYRFDNDEKMKRFVERNRENIRLLIPGDNYPGFKKLMNEFINLQNQ